MFLSTRWIPAATAVALALAGCASSNLDLPAVTDAPTGQRLAGKIVWHDLLTHTPEASRRFYGELFGWEFDGTTGQDGYTVIRHNGRPIGGMIDTRKLNGRDDISQWIAVMSVDDVDAAAVRFEAAGGSVLTPPTELERRGRLAVVADAEGALLALLQSRSGDPADRAPELGDFLWDELWSREPASAQAFYADLAGFEADSVAAGGGEYRVLRSQARPRAGILPHPLEGLGPVWVSYLRVADPAAITQRVEGLGGRVLVDAQARRVGGQAAMIAGPSGAGIALQTWPLDGASQERT